MATASPVSPPACPSCSLGNQAWSSQPTLTPFFGQVRAAEGETLEREEEKEPEEEEAAAARAPMREEAPHCPSAAPSPRRKAWSEGPVAVRLELHLLQSR